MRSSLLAVTQSGRGRRRVEGFCLHNELADCTVHAVDGRHLLLLCPAQSEDLSAIISKVHFFESSTIKPLVLFLAGKKGPGHVTSFEGKRKSCLLYSNRQESKRR